jgi:hypothetical protein
MRGCAIEGRQNALVDPGDIQLPDERVHWLGRAVEAENIADRSAAVRGNIEQLLYLHRVCSKIDDAQGVTSKVEDCFG